MFLRSLSVSFEEEDGLGLPAVFLESASDVQRRVVYKVVYLGV